MRGVFYTLVFFLAATARADVSETEFLRSCFSVCAEMRETSVAKHGLAAINLRNANLVDRYDEASREIDELRVKGFDVVVAAEGLSRAAAAWILDQGAPFPAPGLTPVETAAIQQYTGQDYTQLNEALRRKAPMSAEVVAYVGFVTQALAKLPSYHGPLKRGLRSYPNWQARYLKGAVVTERGFSSFTNRLDDYKFEGPINFNIISTAGRDISGISRIPKEGEILYPPGSRFRVLDVRPRANEAVDIDLEDLNGDPAGRGG